MPKIRALVIGNAYVSYVSFVFVGLLVSHGVVEAVQADAAEGRNVISYRMQIRWHDARSLV